MPSHHAICPPMRYFKAMKAVSFILKKRNSAVFGRFRVINCHTQYESHQGNACIHKANKFSKNIPLKLNLILCHENKRNLKCHKGSNG